MDGRMDGYGMQHAWEGREIYTRFGKGTLKEINHLDLEMDMRIILK